MQAFQLIVSLSILVLIHELGHFLFAKLFGARVDKFYLFFNPWFALFKFRKGETEYGLGWLPIGGYCKIAGMVDESFDKKQMGGEPKPWEYRSKKLYQRFLIISGGVIFNFILAILIYASMLYTWGESYLPVSNAKYGIYCDSTALSLGLRNGDKVLKVDTITPVRLSDVTIQILLEDAKTITVERDKKIEVISIPEDLKSKLIANQKSFFIIEFIPFIVDSVMPNTPAEKAQLQKNDKILALDTISTPAFYDFVNTVKNYKNKQTTVLVNRKGEDIVVPITISAEGTIGAYRVSEKDIFEIVTTEYSFLESIPKGISMGLETLGSYIKQFKLVFTKEGSQQVGSFISMGKLYDTSWNWYSFWAITALFSVILAFMNILPIPGLDGGHLMFLVYELITRKKPSDKFLEKTQMIGMAIVLSIFVYAFLLDIIKSV